MKQSYLLAFVLLPFTLLAQNKEIAHFAVYNVLNYRNYTTYCTANNNPAGAKEDYMKTIFNYLEPDVLVLNEMGNNPADAIKIVNRCLNVDGVTKYNMASFAGSSGSSLANALYYNTEMFGVESVERIANDVSGGSLVRLIDVFHLYYNHENLALGADTTYVTVFAAHLKAGSSSSDKAQRAEATEAVMEYISDNNITGNYVIVGDFNVQSSSEASFQNLINGAEAFVDPINRLGGWNNNSQFADVHTQSTRSSSNGCHSGGGLDDRYDFILVSEDANDGNDNMEAIPSSYWAVANDGNHFNESINFPANNSVPQDVLTAIYENSDHLPVQLDFVMTKTDPNSVAEVFASNVKVKAISPSINGVQLQIDAPTNNYLVQVHSLTGQLLMEENVNISSNTALHLPLGYSGMVIISLSADNQPVATAKIIIR